jgi:integrase
MAKFKRSKRPKGPQYRGFTWRGDTIYCSRVVDGKRTRFSLGTSDWEVAVQARALLEHKGAAVEAPCFEEFAQQYLKEATANLAGTTREDRTKLLRPGGTVVREFAELHLDAISKPMLLAWWQREVEAKRRSPRTGLNYLSALAGVLNYAVDLELIEENPVDGLRSTLRRQRRTKQGRADADRAAHVRPIEEPDELRRFVEASTSSAGLLFRGKPRANRWRGHVADLLMLDAGLRTGEVSGLRWRDVWNGKSADDTTRCLVIRESRARGVHDGTTKSGRERRVALSLRLRQLLREHWVSSGQPGPMERVVPAFRAPNYTRRHFAHVLREAGLGEHTPKDLRDTFASQLLTAGVPLPYVSRQLGHADVAVTARHYVKWCAGDSYRQPLELRAGEVPADLLARVAENRPHFDPTWESGAGRTDGAGGRKLA